MSPSWIFPARAEPSRAGHFYFRAEIELDFFLLYSFFSSIFSKISYFKERKVSFSIEKTENRLKMQGEYIKIAIFGFSSWFFISELDKKGHEPSRAENPSGRAMARAS